LQLNATANVPGTFSYSPKEGTVLSAGSHTLTVTFTPSDTVKYTTATATVTLQVRQATPTIIWLPFPLFAGKPLGPAQLDAFALVPGRFWQVLPGKFAYTPPAGTVLKAGWHELQTTFTPANQNYRSVTAHVSVLVLGHDDD
jgi:hypothetical protein